MQPLKKREQKKALDHKANKTAIAVNPKAIQNEQPRRERRSVWEIKGNGNRHPSTWERTRERLTEKMWTNYSGDRGSSPNTVTIQDRALWKKPHAERKIYSLNK